MASALELTSGRLPRTPSGTPTAQPTSAETSMSPTKVTTTWPGVKPSALMMPMSRWLVSTAPLTTLATISAAAPSAKTANASRKVSVRVVVRPKICPMSRYESDPLSAPGGTIAAIS